MKTKLIPLIALLSIAWLYPACSKESPCEKKTEYKYIPAKDREMVPYKGEEKLTFLHVNTGDTVVFEGEPNWTQYFGNSSYGSECVIEEKLEGRGIAFFNSESNHPIVINQYNIEQGGIAFEIQFKDLDIGTLLFGAKKFKLYDSITIQNNLFMNVYFYPSNDVNSSLNKIGCFYTNKEGIIMLVSKTGDTWELISRN